MKIYKITAEKNHTVTLMKARSHLPFDTLKFDAKGNYYTTDKQLAERLEHNANLQAEEIKVVPVKELKSKEKEIAKLKAELEDYKKESMKKK